MKKFPERLIKAAPLVIIIIGVLAIGYWLWFDPTGEFTLSEPGKDDVSGSESVKEKINIGENFKSFTTFTTLLRETWPRFRGDQSDNIKKSEIPLIDKFSQKPPKTLWSVDLGEGHSGASIYEGMVYLMDYDEEIRADMLRCFSLETGVEVWRRWYSIQIKRNHGMSRTVPAVTDKYILTMGPRGHIMCLERTTGNYLWGKDISQDYESEIPLWYTGQCPIIINDVAIIATGGKALIIGIDCSNGKILWTTPNPDGWKMSHSSVMPFTFKGRNMLVYSAVGGAVGISADGPDAGTILWKTSLWNKSVVASSAVCMPDGKVFLTAGYGAGSMMLQIEEDGGKFSVKMLQSIKPGDGLSCEQQTPILKDGYLFGIMPKDAKALRNQMVCVKADDPTKVVWSSGSETRFGLGPYILADNKFYLLNDNATLYIIKYSTTGFVELDHINLFEGHDAWAPLAIADGYMVLRDSKKMICIDLKR